MKMSFWRKSFVSSVLLMCLTWTLGLADTKDGQPLPPREGPFRIIVPGEKRPARWVRQVSAVTVHKN
jgi:hypothetical protein